MATLSEKLANQIRPPQECGVEGCRYEQTDDDGCGLRKLRVETYDPTTNTPTPIGARCEATLRTVAIVEEEGW